MNGDRDERRKTHLQGLVVEVGQFSALLGGKRGDTFLSVGFDAVVEWEPETQHKKREKQSELQSQQLSQIVE